MDFSKQFLYQDEMRGIGCACTVGTPINPMCRVHGHLAKESRGNVLAGIIAPEPETATSVTIGDRPEPSAVAFLCFSEDELDNWWDGLDVEAKADAFAGFSLRAQGQGDSFIHVPEPRIPVAGTIGAVSQPDGHADQAVRS
jgi:hypothetical protein